METLIRKSHLQTYHIGGTVVTECLRAASEGQVAVGVEVFDGEEGGNGREGKLFEINKRSYVRRTK